MGSLFVPTSAFRVFVLFLIIIESCGIRFFAGQGTLLSMTILALLLPVTLPSITKREINFIFTISTIFAIIYACNGFRNTSKLVFQILMIMQAFLFLKLYDNKKAFLDDLYKCLLLLFYHAVVNILFYYLFSRFFVARNIGGMPYESFGFFFFVIKADSASARNIGLMWEAGLLQLMMNLLLFICIKNRKPVWFQLLVAAVIITTHSTSGYIALLFNVFYAMTRLNRKTILIILTLMVIGVVCGFNFLSNNISDKFGGKNVSGLIRYRDFKVGAELVKHRPIVGHGFFDTNYLVSIDYVRTIEAGIQSDYYIKTYGYLTGGYTNGLLGVFIAYGIPMGLLIFYYFFRNRFLNKNLLERTIFFTIFCIALISEPISYTPFFLLFPLSNFAGGTILSSKKSSAHNAV